MKPGKWDEMPKKERTIAVKPLNSNRGQSVMGHALETAIQWMGIDPQPEKTTSRTWRFSLRSWDCREHNLMDIGVRALCIDERNSE